MVFGTPLRTSSQLAWRKAASSLRQISFLEIELAQRHGGSEMPPIGPSKFTHGGKRGVRSAPVFFLSNSASREIRFHTSG